MLKFDDRFARQDRYEPPPEFPLASPCSSIVHHLSGLSTRALAPQLLASSRLRAGVAPGTRVPGSRPFCLSYATGVRRAHRLARVLNSLVRVSRRVGRSAGNHAARTPRVHPTTPADGRGAPHQTASSLAKRPASHRRRGLVPKDAHAAGAPQPSSRRHAPGL